MARRDLTGQRFNRLTAERYDPVRKNWVCRCDCGNVVYVRITGLVQGKTKSCGCYIREMRPQIKRTHGHNTDRLGETSEYRSWRAMKARCQNPNASQYAYYGGRGIKVCERWQQFENFLADMGPKPTPRHTIERDDNNGHYEPGNCRWATHDEQVNNCTQNRVLTFNGVTDTVAGWARRTGLPYFALMLRIRRGMDVEQALTQPLRITAATRARPDQ